MLYGLIAFFVPKTIQSATLVSGEPPKSFYTEYDYRSTIKSEYISNRDLTIKLMREAGLSEGVINEFLYIGNRESRFIADIQNAHSSAKGIYEILDSTKEGAHCEGDMKVAYWNILCAIRLYRLDGMHPWDV